jgi:hypothetical protein
MLLGRLDGQSARACRAASAGRKSRPSPAQRLSADISPRGARCAGALAIPRSTTLRRGKVSCPGRPGRRSRVPIPPIGHIESVLAMLPAANAPGRRPTRRADRGVPSGARTTRPAPGQLRRSPPAQAADENGVLRHLRLQERGSAPRPAGVADAKGHAGTRWALIPQALYSVASPDGDPRTQRCRSRGEG